MRRIPLRAVRNPSHSWSFELPRGVKQPKPLITILSGSTRKSYTARVKPQALVADMTIARPNMDIPPITNLPRIVESTGRHQDRQQQKRQQPRRQEKITPVPVYTPDG